MKRIVLLCTLLGAFMALAQQGAGNAPTPFEEQRSSPPPQQQTVPQPTAPQPAVPAGKPLPQAKTQDEYKAYQQSSQLQDPAALEAAANDFANKFKDSELRYLLYYRAMFGYQAQNNGEKTIEMGRKVLALNPNEPVTLAVVAQMLSEKTPETDPNREARLQEATRDAFQSLAKLDTDLVVPPGTPPERVEQNKKMLRSIAYATIGNLYLARDNYAQAEKNLKQAMDLAPEPDVVTILRYSIALEQQKKYSEALTAANRALQLAPAGSPQAGMARQERERLLKLSEASTATP